jgi:hypothetical protein
MWIYRSATRNPEVPQNRPEDCPVHTGLGESGCESVTEIEKHKLNLRLDRLLYQLVAVLDVVQAAFVLSRRMQSFRLSRSTSV